MMQKSSGIHHITAMVNDAQRTIDFYAGILGLRMMKIFRAGDRSYWKMDIILQ